MKTDTGKYVYEIRIRGHLDQHWRAWFENWTIIELEDGDTLLRSAPIDQSAVHGVLSKIRDINLPLLSVARKM